MNSRFPGTHTTASLAFLIRISGPDVAEPVAVRYAWEPFPDCNPFNSDGLPASPFRTDDFEVGHYLPLKPYLERRKKNKE